jgi:hypothetical protein
MKAMSKSWMALVVGVAVMAGVIPSWADPVPNDDDPVPAIVSQDAYNEWIGDVYGRGTIPRPFREFDFSPSNDRIYDGEVLSTVYYGKGPAEGLFVYVYQVIHYATSSESEIDNIYFDFFGPILTNPSRQHDPRLPRIFSFQVSGTGRELIGSSISFRLSRVRFSFGGLSSNDGLLPGQHSCLFGFFSQIRPTITVATVTDTGRRVTSPLVYTPSPEPSVGVMFGLGLLGLPFFRKLRRKFMK